MTDPLSHRHQPPADRRAEALMDARCIEAYVDAAAAALDLPLAPAHRPGVLRYFSLAAEMAELVNGLPLGVTDEPAEAFVPVSPSAPEGGA